MRGETGATLRSEDLRLQRRLGLPRQTHSTPPLLTDHEPPHALASPAGLGRTPRGYGLCGPRGDHPTESTEGQKLPFAAGQPGTSPFGLAEEVESVAQRHPGEGGTCLRHVFLNRTGRQTPGKSAFLWVGLPMVGLGESGGKRGNHRLGWPKVRFWHGEPIPKCRRRPS
jgi:hypothetical protein